MSEFEPRFAGYESKVRNSFARQPINETLGIEITRLQPGEVEFKMPYNRAYAQQHGFLQAGIVSAALDGACGYAAFSLMDEDAAILTVEFKTNFLAPADGEVFYFRGNVVKPGRTLTVTSGTAYAVKAGEEKAIATMSATMMALFNRKGIEQ